MSLTPTIPNPQQLQQATDAMSAPNVAKMQIQDPQQPQVPVAHPGMVKATLMNFFHGFGESALHAAGLPTMYERQRQAITDQNATIQAQSKAALEQSQATQIGGKNEVERYKADQKYAAGKNAANAALAKTGYQMSEDANGNPVMVPIAPDQLSEEAKSLMGLQQSKAEFNRLAGLKAQADADVKMNPNNPTFIQNQKKIDAQMEMMKQNWILKLQGNQMRVAQFEINNAVKPDGSPATIQGNGQMVDANGNPIGKNFQNINGPTAATRGAADQGRAILDAGKNLKAQIHANRDKMGNMDSILNTAFLGTPASDPASSKLAASIASFAALNPRLHGFRGSQALAEFKKLLGSNINNPDSVKAAIDGISETAGSVIKAGTVHTNANTKKDSLGIF